MYRSASSPNIRSLVWGEGGTGVSGVSGGGGGGPQGIMTGAVHLLRAAPIGSHVGGAKRWYSSPLFIVVLYIFKIL